MLVVILVVAVETIIVVAGPVAPVASKFAVAGSTFVPFVLPVAVAFSSFASVALLETAVLVMLQLNATVPVMFLLNATMPGPVYDSQTFFF